MKQALRLLSVLLVFACVCACVSCLSSCTFGANKTMDGDKNVLERTLKLDEAGVWTLVVHNIRFSGDAPDRFISIAPSHGPAVKIATDDNVFTSLTVDINRDTRVVTIEGDPACTYKPSEFSISFGSPVSAVNLEGGYKLDALVTGVGTFALHTAGAVEGSVVFDRLDEITVSSEGAADLKLEGRCATLMLKADGAAKVDASKAEAEIANIKLSGACTTQVNVTGDLYAEASGACVIEASGSPNIKQQAMSGVSELILK